MPQLGLNCHELFSTADLATATSFHRLSWTKQIISQICVIRGAKQIENQRNQRNPWLKTKFMIDFYVDGLLRLNPPPRLAS